ncbi:hypothetical protein [Streptomyces sp. NPDC059378]|uniref:hypothetical protein n=1 Tax=Streptomyces sp. NPDC059378 TaxID=3346815 RepID=UPI00368526ED
MNRFQFVADHQRRHGVKRLCTILGIARSSFYYWRRTAEDRAARQAADARLATRIRAVHLESGGTYGPAQDRARNLVEQQRWNEAISEICEATRYGRHDARCVVLALMYGWKVPPIGPQRARPLGKA